MALQIGDKFIHRLFVRPVEADVIIIIDGDGVDQDVLAAQEAGQFLSAGISAGQALDEDIFKGDFSACDVEIVTCRLEDGFQGIFFGNGHDPPPQGVVRRVEGHGQGDGHALFGQVIHLGDDARRGQCHVAIAQIERILVVDELHETDDVVIIEERFPRPHDDDGVQFRRDVFTESQELGDHFTGRQVADKAVLGRRAEGAVDGTADLGRHADGIAVIVHHEHRFDGFAVRELQEQLDCLAIGRVQAGHDFRKVNGQDVFEKLPVFLGQQDHFIPGKDIFFIDIMENLVGPEFLHSLGDEERLQFLFRHIEEVIHVHPPFSCGQ